MVFSIIKKSQLEGANRLDAEYYQPEYLKIGQKLFNSPKLFEVSKKITDFGAYSQMNFVNFVDSGIRFFRNQDIGEFLINDSDPMYVTNDVYRRLSLKLDEFDIVTPRVGTIGTSAVIFKDNLPASANQNLAQIKVDLSKIDPIYLSIFLCSNYGRNQFERAATGNVQPWLNLQQIKSLRVFVPPNEQQKNIKDLALESRRIYLISLDLYKQAENLLLEELELKNFRILEDLSYIVNYSDTEEVNRVDADYFQPKYEFLIKKLEGKKRLSEFAERINTSFKVELDKEYNYIEISDINVGTGEVVFNKIVGKELPANAKIKISGGELIISKVRPTRGAIAIIPDRFNEDFVASGAFSIFKIASPAREYLQVVLRSMIGKLQMERPTTGTSYPTVTDEDVENIFIPVLSKEAQQKIADLVIKSHEARKKSKELLEEAKRKVEEMIEKNV